MIVPESSIALLLGVVMTLLLTYVDVEHNHWLVSIKSITETKLLLIILPPIVYAGALNTNLSQFYKNIGTILIYAVFATIIGAFLTSFVSFNLVNLIFDSGYGFDLHHHMLFGIILSTADTVAVLSAFSQMKIDPNISTLVIGESLVNDAVAINVFQ